MLFSPQVASLCACVSWNEYMHMVAILFTGFLLAVSMFVTCHTLVDDPAKAAKVGFAHTQLPAPFEIPRTGGFFFLLGSFFLGCGSPLSFVVSMCVTLVHDPAKAAKGG